MLYKKYEEPMSEIKEHIKLLRKQLYQVHDKIKKYELSSNKDLSDFEEYNKLLDIRKNYAIQIARLESDLNKYENLIYKDLYIQRYGEERAKDWDGVIL